MNQLLLITTLLSLAVAIVSAVLAWRVIRLERRRSELRVAGLAAQTADEELESARLITSSKEGEVRVWHRDPLSAPDAASSIARKEVAAEPAGTTVSAAARLFDAQETRPAGTPRAAFAVAGVLLVVVSAALRTITSSGSEAPVMSAAASAAPTPLELLSLRHQREQDSLVVTGLVRNPTGAPERAGVVAVAFFFDAEGTFVASGRAPLEVRRLAPGDESPFVVSLAKPGNARRYRVSFRVAEGQIVPHLDRRERPRG